MGIKGLSKLINQYSDGTGSIKETDIKAFFGRKIAIDASMTLYQFLIAVRFNDGGDQLKADDGGETSHLQGFLYRTIRMLENGIKPVYVFDGKPPDFKSHELEKRKQMREKAKQELKEAELNEDTAKISQMQKRLVKVSKKHVKEAQRLLDCLGVPWVEAPSEAEAQCAAMVRDGVVYAAATEDMDVLTFGTPTMVRHLTFSQAKKIPVLEINLDKVLKSLNVTMDQFVDICILCGCDYIPSIRGIGPVRAHELILKHKNIENLLIAIENNDKFIVPEKFLFEQARELFKKPEIIQCHLFEKKNNKNNKKKQIIKDSNDTNNNVNFEIKTKDGSNDNNANNENDSKDNDNSNNDNNNNNKDNSDSNNNNNDENNENNENKTENCISEVRLDSVEIRWTDPNESLLIEYLVNEKGFSLDRIKTAFQRCLKSKGKSSQTRMDSFFKIGKTVTSTTKLKKMELKNAKNKKSKKNNKKSKNNSKPGVYADRIIGKKRKTMDKSVKKKKNDPKSKTKTKSKPKAKTNNKDNKIQSNTKSDSIVQKEKQNGNNDNNNENISFVSNKMSNDLNISEKESKCDSETPVKRKILRKVNVENNDFNDNSGNDDDIDDLDGFDDQFAMKMDQDLRSPPKKKQRLIKSND